MLGICVVSTSECFLLFEGRGEGRGVERKGGEGRGGKTSGLQIL